MPQERWIQGLLAFHCLLLIFVVAFRRLPGVHAAVFFGISKSPAPPRPPPRLVLHFSHRQAAPQRRARRRLQGSVWLRSWLAVAWRGNTGPPPLVTLARQHGGPSPSRPCPCVLQCLWCTLLSASTRWPPPTGAPSPARTTLIHRQAGRGRSRSVDRAWEALVGWLAGLTVCMAGLLSAFVFNNNVSRTIFTGGAPGFHRVGPRGVGNCWSQTGVQMELKGRRGEPCLVQPYPPCPSRGGRACPPASCP